MISTGTYPGRIKEDVIPTSDGAGEIIALGSDVNPKTFKVGDRVAANFSLEHLSGPVSAASVVTSQGGPIDGALQEYRIYPARVRNTGLIAGGI